MGILHPHGHITVLLFLLIIKNYCMQDVTHSEVDSWCNIDSLSNLQIRGGGGGGGRSTKW